MTEVDVRTGAAVSVGNDSKVYRVGNQVAKEYKTLPYDAVERYVELQNAAVQVLARLRYEAVFPIRGVPHTITIVRGTPVDEVGVSSGGLPLTLSEFVVAPNLEKLTLRPDAFAQYAEDQLPDDGLRTFAADLNGLFSSEYPTRVQDEFHYHLCLLSRLLDRELGVFGLYIGKYNAKLEPVDGERRIDVIVTDVAVYIDRIRYDG